MVNFDTNLLEHLQVLEPKIKHRKLVLEKPWNNWTFQMFFGPSVDREEEELDMLEFTLFGYTDSLKSGPVPSMPNDLSGVLISFDNRAFAKWSKPTRAELEDTVQKSFSCEIDFTKGESHE